MFSKYSIRILTPSIAINLVPVIGFGSIDITSYVYAYNSHMQLLHNKIHNLLLDIELQATLT